MPISGNGGGFDPTKFIPIVSEGAQSTNTTFGTILSVTGRGYLKSAVISSANADAKSLKITIDGVLKIFVVTQAVADLAAGVFQEGEFQNSTGVVARIPTKGTYAAISSIGGQPYPYTGGGQYSFSLSDALYFSNSLLIQVAATVSGIVNYRVQGAYQP